MDAAEGHAAIGSLASTLQRVVLASPGPSDPFSILFSGGLDSGLLAHLLRHREPTLVAVGAAGSHDLAAAEEGAELLHLRLVCREVSPADVGRALQRWARLLQAVQGSDRSVAVGTALALEVVRTKVVLCGQGADEIFRGYAHFRGASPAEVARRAESDLAKLRDREWPRAVRIAEELNLDLRAPYLDPVLVEQADSFGEAHLPTPTGLTKPVLRAAARMLGLPEELVGRPKKAMQYGSGVARILRSLDRPPTSRSG